MRSGYCVLYGCPVFLWVCVEEASRRYSEWGRLPCSYCADASLFQWPPWWDDPCILFEIKKPPSSVEGLIKGRTIPLLTLRACVTYKNGEHLHIYKPKWNGAISVLCQTAGIAFRGNNTSGWKAVMRDRRDRLSHWKHRVLKYILFKCEQNTSMPRNVLGHKQNLPHSYINIYKRQLITALRCTSTCDK